jgi:ribonuclease P protein component
MAARHVVRGEFFDLHYCATGTDQAARLGLMVPKRLARAASLRNAIKRQGREVFRSMAMGILPCDLVLRLKRALKGVSARDVGRRKAWRTELESLLRQLPPLSR